MQYYIVDAFTDQPFGGNPAGVVLLDGNSFPSETRMLQIAAELRYSETAFVRRDAEKEFTIRYFTPMAEVELCGHATIASFALMHRKLGVTGRCFCHTNAGDISVEAGPRVLMQMTASKIVQIIDETKEIYQAIGVNDYTPALPVMIVSTGLPDFMIQVGDVETLNSLPLDMNAISAVTEKHNAVSFHVFAFGNDGHTAHVRDFGPLYGIPEESATGTANASLTHYLQQNGCIPPTGDFSFLQGEAMGRPSVVATRVTTDGTIYGSGGGRGAEHLKQSITTNMKKVIVISTSLRPGSNSHAMAEQFAKGAEAAGHQVEFVSLRGKEIKFCVGCLSCQKTGACVIKDDVPAIMESVLNADVVCWATPIYYYEMSGQMKTLIDRMNAMYPKDYKFREVYLLTTAAENEEFVPKRAEGGLTGWIDCYEKSALKGHIFCGGVGGPNEIAGNAKLQEAFEMGKNI